MNWQVKGMKLRYKICFGWMVSVSLMVSGQTRKPTLDSVLSRLDELRMDYFRSLPSLFASEHVVSSVRSESNAFSPQRTTTDSIFRVLRSGEMPKPTFTESRVVQKVDGKDADPSVKLHGPVISAGIFSYALLLVTSDMRACFDYKLQVKKKHGRVSALTIFYKQKPANKSGPDCPQSEDAEGVAEIDPVSYHVRSMEKTIEHLRLSEESEGSWVWKVEYAPTTLGTKSFWLPKSIFSRSQSDDVATLSIWKFVATYSDYHLFHADARILLPGIDKAVTEHGDNSPTPAKNLLEGGSNLPAKEDRNEKEKDENKAKDENGQSKTK